MRDKCQHRWGKVLVKYRNKVLMSSARVCLKCGLLKIGDRTIRISRFRIDMEGKPIKNVSQIDISNRLKIPVGANLFS